MNISNVTFGIEIETIIPHAAGVSVGPYHAGVPVPQAPHFNGASWRAERDQSICARSCDYVACEFVSPVLRGEAGVQHLLEFVAWLNSIGAKVNPSCGLHIHVGVNSIPLNPNFRGKAEMARETFLGVLARTVSRYSGALYAQTGSISREAGRFCAPLNAQYEQAVNQASRSKHIEQLPGDRYRLLNLCPVRTKGTVEFRCFAGTLNSSKILLHLWSVLALCRNAAEAKYLGHWPTAPHVLRKCKQITGGKKVQILLSRMWQDAAEWPVFIAHRDEMQRIGLKMAAKYDAAKAGRTPQMTTNAHDAQRVQAFVIANLTEANRLSEVPSHVLRARAAQQTA